MSDALELLTELPSWVLYVLLAGGAGLENVFPPVPADSFVVLGGVLAGRGLLSPTVVFGVTWSANVVSALAVYWLGYHYGRDFFETGVGRHVLSSRQLERMRDFYRRWGTAAIFLTRFLPGLRAVVPGFAGVSHLGVVRVALPIVMASAVWYGLLVWISASASRNIEAIIAWLGGVNDVLLGAAILVVLSVGVWWWRTRHPPDADHEPRRGDRKDDRKGETT